MKKNNKKRKDRKELPIAVNLILILIFSVTFVVFGICIGFLINSFINYSVDNILIYGVMTLVVGTIYMVVLLMLVRNSDSENVKTTKWYINCVLISFTTNLIITAITIFTLGPEESYINYLIGFVMFPLIGIITTPNIVNYVKNDTTKWKKVFYDNGTLHKTKPTKDFYKVGTPVSFEKKILSAIYKEQFKNVLIVVGIMAMVIVVCISHILNGHSYSGNVIMDLIEQRIYRGFGSIFFLAIFFFTFGIPIISFYLANALKKIRVVKKHEYIAYHAIVSNVNSGKINICDEKKKYTYKYCTCVGIKEKNVHDTPATLIFIPDDVLLFTDKEETKEDK